MLTVGSPAIRAEGLQRSFGPKVALAGLDLEVRAGTVLGLLGPNGDGKTTAVRILTTLLRPDARRAQVAGFDVDRQPARVRDRIGLVGQHAALDEILSGRQNLVLFGRLHHLGRRRARERAGELLADFGLQEAADQPVAQYSAGMRPRLDLAAGLVLAPSVLFLDEPTAGLDPRGRAEAWRAVRALVGRGATVLLTTQYPEEADQLADRIVLIDHGRVVAAGTPVRWSVADTWTMTGRDLAHWARQPGGVVVVLLFPALVLLMFGYLLGGQMSLGSNGYREFLVPGVFAMTMVFGLESTMLAVATDASRGVTDRFRSISMSPVVVVGGRSVADLLGSVVGLAVMVACGFAIGTSVPGAGPLTRRVAPRVSGSGRPGRWLRRRRAGRPAPGRGPRCP